MRLAIIIGFSLFAGFTSADDSNKNFNVVFPEVEQNPCTTNENCVSWEKCTAYKLGLTTKRRRTDKHNQYVEFLKSRQCGFEGYMPLVCCPKVSNGTIPPLSDVKNTKGIVENPKDTKKDGCFDGAHINSKQSSKPCSPSLPESKRPESGNKISYFECGKDLNYRHKSGINTEPFEFPWLALLEYDTLDGKEFLCSGVLINDQYILTAAHCVSSAPRNVTNVYLGEYNTRTNIDCIFKDGSKICADATVKIGIEKVYYHEGYKGDGITHRGRSRAAVENKGIVMNFGSGEMPDSDDFNQLDDVFMSHNIGLIKLKHKVTFSQYIQPICLPEHSHERQKLFVSGWGKNMNIHTEGSDRKRMSALTEVDNEDCQKISALPFVTEEHICAGIRKSIKEQPCVGDSGGPLMGFEEKADGTLRMTVFGVSYMDKRCQDTSLPGVYTRVYDHMPWILQQIGKK